MLNIVKVLQRPVTPEPNTLYFEKAVDSTAFFVYITDNLGEIIDLDAITGGSADIVQIVSALVNQPNGIAGLNAQGSLDTSVTIDGQDTRLVTGSGGLIWQDYITSIEVRGTSGQNNPAFNTYMGNFQGYLFHASSMNQAWCNFHIAHDYAMGTYIFPHVHWLPTTNSAGAVRWGFEIMVAKGHSQQVFGNPVTVYATTSVPANSLGLHVVSEVSEADAILPTNLEPDSFVKVRVFRDAAHPEDTYPGLAHAWFCDLHYQSDKFGTVNRAPNFFGAS